ncbi:MAG: urea carboxylase, partial [Leifsonia sp.]
MTFTTTVPVGAVHGPDAVLDRSAPLVGGAVLLDEDVAPRAAWSGVVRAGQVLTIVDVGGNQS